MSQDPLGDDAIGTESRRLTPSVSTAHDSESPADSSNEDFLFHLYRGSELLQDNRVHEAKEELERALHLQPRDSKGQDLIAVVYFRLGLYARAIQIYEQLRRRNTNNTALLLNLALCYLKSGQPELAKRDLEQLLELNPTHARGWGYLGLAYEHLGDLAQAERAFAQGGHTQMAKRVALRREAGIPAEDGQAAAELREVAGTAYHDLETGELSFHIAEPTPDRFGEEEKTQSWNSHELGKLGARERISSPGRADGSKDPLDAPVPSIPQLAHNQSPNRRPTLIAPHGAPPAQELASEYSALERISSQKPASLSFDDTGGTPSLRRPVVAVPSPFGPPRSHEAPANATTKRTLPPPPVSHADMPPRPEAPPAKATPVADAPPVSQTPASLRSGAPASLRSGAPASIRSGLPRTPSVPHPTPSVPADEPRPAASVHFPHTGVILHPSGVALVRTTSELGFAARLEAIRAQQSGLQMHLLERQMKGRSTGESFGGIASPMVLATGDGQLVLAARPGRKVTAFDVGGEMCFAREDVLLGFGGGLAFENGRLATGEGESVPVVQLRGDGSVLLEGIGDVLTLAVHPDRSLSVRREVILGWFGRLVPRHLAPGDAPCGQRGLVSFAGDGRVLIASS
ncbi:MAG TPA: tetratricopeptide repeat protein [Labilithrix sp.]|nr:tetratricopeptide repeat protein [Labilithrix sp.]